MSKYKLRWMQDFEIHNMDFDNLGLAIKMLITLDDGAKLTVTNPTGSIQAYRMSNGKVEWTQDEIEGKAVTMCEDVTMDGSVYLTGTTAPTISWDVGTAAVSPQITLREPSTSSILDDIRSRALSTKNLDPIDELREKIQKLTGINPALIGDSISTKNPFTNTTASQIDQMKLRDGGDSLAYNARSKWVDTMRHDLLTPTPITGITHPLLA